MLTRPILRLHQTRLVLGASLARKLRTLSRTRIRLYQSSLISHPPKARYVRHELPSDESRAALESRHWMPPELTEAWQQQFRKAEDAQAWQFVLYEYERRN